VRVSWKPHLHQFSDCDKNLQSSHHNLMSVCVYSQTTTIPCIIYSRSSPQHFLTLSHTPHIFAQYTLINSSNFSWCDPHTQFFGSFLKSSLVTLFRSSPNFFKPVSLSLQLMTLRCLLQDAWGSSPMHLVDSLMPIVVKASHGSFGGTAGCVVCVVCVGCAGCAIVRDDRIDQEEEYCGFDRITSRTSYALI
jgi:hypothetical protein